ncbi:outer membrane beta-barrel protein [uncultured Amphritea sp.]|uniref:outer membrane beta-barrel protein n=1 Tax=uncultured Amphritea sp. TaxID=981605 RepID=UPI0025EB51E2|nr:outer membrane beta-barrel protein [uncultured Amphritea sp.]
MKKALLGLGIIAALTPAMASAEGGYFGASYGRTEVQFTGEEKAAFNDLGYSRIDEVDQGFKVFGGYRFNKNFSLEGFYADLGDAEVSNGTVNIKAATDGYGLSAVGLYPVTDQIDLFAKLGMFHWSVDATSNVDISLGDDGTDATYGIGAAYNMETVSLRAEFERFDIGGDDIDMISAGVQINF